MYRLERLRDWLLDKVDDVIEAIEAWWRRNSQAGQWAPGGIVAAALTLILFLVILRVFGLI